MPPWLMDLVPAAGRRVRAGRRDRWPLAGAVAGALSLAGADARTP